MFGDNFTPRARGMFLPPEDTPIESRDLVPEDVLREDLEDFSELSDPRAGDINIFDAVNNDLLPEIYLIAGSRDKPVKRGGSDSDPVTFIGYSELMAQELARGHDRGTTPEQRRATRYSL